MLPFHEQIVGELLEGDGVVVMAAGLGLCKVLASLLRLHSRSDGLLLLLSTSDPQRQALREEMQDQDPAAQLPMEINNEYGGAERLNFYSEGGSFFITSRILIVDMLNARVPLQKVAGIIVNNAHRLSETCAEAFIVRLFRQANKKGFVQAFSDRPQAMISGFSKTERIMKSLFVKRLYIWPRFHLSVSGTLEETPPEVIDIRMPLTNAMAGIQNAILEVMDACLKELRKTNKVDVEDLTVENGLLKSFDEIIRRQLDPIWHTVGRKTKQLVGDLKTLRKLVEYLQRYDAVTFLKYLDTLRVSEGVRSAWIFANPTHKIFELAKRRAYQLVRTDGTRLVHHKGTNGAGLGGRDRRVGRHSWKGKPGSKSNDPERAPARISVSEPSARVGTGSRIAFTSESDAEGEGISAIGPELNLFDNLAGSRDAPWVLSEEEDQEGGKRRRINGNVTISTGGTSSILDDLGGPKTGEARLGQGDEIGDPREASNRMEGVVGEVEGVELEVVVEEMPKWKVLREVLEEIEEERQRVKAIGATEVRGSQNAWGEGGGAVLVACKDERMCVQLQDVVTHGPQKLMRDEWTKYLLGKAELHGMRTRSRKKSNGAKGMGIMNGKGSPRSWRGDDGDGVQNEHKQEQDALMAAAAEVAAHEREVIVVGEDVPIGKGLKTHGRGRGRQRTGEFKKICSEIPCNKKGRGVGHGHTAASGNEHGGKPRSSGKGKTKVAESTASESPDLIDVGVESRNPQRLEKDNLELADGEKSLEEAETTTRPLPPVHFYALESQQRVLEVVRPLFVVVYDPDMGFVREMEVYKAENPTQPLKVYFLFYEDSTEGRKFEASIQRENSAFEGLIRQKASMMIPVDQDGRMLDATPPPQTATGVTLNAATRKAGGRKAAEKQMQVVVDMREFGSSLPSVLHQQGMRILPVTLEVGDYILSPDICVERKSVADLFSSFTSGRLYHQAETMTRYYRLPVLLIEFSQDKSFSLQSANDMGEEILPANIVSKVSLLVLHFPRLRIVWSRSLHATADIFSTLKANQDEPDLERAMRVGVPTEDGLIEGDIRAENYNTTAVELLRRLPGVTDANYRTLMDECKSLAEVALLRLERLAELMGGQRPARMLRDFLDAKCPTLL